MAVSCRALGIVQGELQVCEAVSVPDGPAGVPHSGWQCQTLSSELHLKK